MADFTTQTEMAPGLEPDAPPVVQSDFAERLLRRISDDYSNAKNFMGQFHRNCLDYHALYHSAMDYKNLRRQNKFPDSLFQELVDVATADALDKTFYSSRPCQVVPLEDTDKEDADAKQALFDYQDAHDDTYRKIQMLYRSGFEFGIAPAQVIYREQYKTTLVTTDEPQTYVDSNTGETLPQLDGMGQQITVSKTQPQQVPIYLGASTQVIDPLNIYLTGDKATCADEFPVMVRSEVSKDYLKSLSYTFDVDEIKSPSEAPKTDNLTEQKREMIGFGSTNKTSAPSGMIEYVEWFGLVNKKELYEYLLSVSRLDDTATPVDDPEERCWCIGGMANGSTMVRIEESPFPFDGPNLIIGVIEPMTGEVLGLGFGAKLYGICKALERLNDTWVENLKQSVNAGSIINRNALKKTGEIKTNVAGWVLETTDDVNKVYKRVEMPKIADDIYRGIEMLRARAKASVGIEDMQSGRGDPAANTATAASVVANLGGQRMRNYIRSLEESLIQPLYSMRNQINMAFLDQNYVIGIVGEAGLAWRTITPDQIRANVDFICTASQRESNRAVITQQMIQFGDPAALAEKAGFPVRWDLFLKDLGEQGFTWSAEKLQKLLPTIDAESKGLDVNSLMLMKFLAMQGAKIAPPQPAGKPGSGGSPTAPGGPPNQEAPSNEGAALGGIANRNLPNAGAM